MNSLELVRRLYEGETDLAALENELDEGSREELQHLVEAKDALERMPRRRPSADLIESVVARATQDNRRRPGLVLVRAGGLVQRLAAAAIVVIAVGVGYLTLRTDSFIPIDKENAAAASSQVPESAELRQFADNDDAPALEESMPAEPESPSPMDTGRRAKREAFRPGLDEVGALAAAETVESKSRNDGYAVADLNKPVFVDTALNKVLGDGREPLAWDDDEEALRTFFWQVQALDGRSPAEGWEEAVPLEGSFEHLEKQQPGNDHWLETRSEK